MALKDFKLPPIFEACCAEENLRYAIAEPFVFGERVYATDGQIIVRLNETFKWMNAKTSQQKLPDPTRLDWDNSFGEPVPLPEQTEAQVNCNKAKPLGPASKNTPAPKYIALLRKHGVTEIRPPRKVDSSDAWYFQGKGFDGLLMPKTVSKQ